MVGLQEAAGELVALLSSSLGAAQGLGAAVLADLADALPAASPLFSTVRLPAGRVGRAVHALRPCEHSVSLACAALLSS